MKTFYKQFIFLLTAGVIITAGALAIKAVGGNIKIQVGYHRDWQAPPVAWWKFDEASWNGTQLIFNF